MRNQRIAPWRSISNLGAVTPFSLEKSLERGEIKATIVGAKRILQLNSQPITAGVHVAAIGVNRFRFDRQFSKLRAVCYVCQTLD
jgi:hypothetical protein